MFKTKPQKPKSNLTIVSAKVTHSLTIINLSRNDHHVTNYDISSQRKLVIWFKKFSRYQDKVFKWPDFRY